MRKQIEYLADEICEELKEEFTADDTFEASMLRRKVRKAIEDVIRARKYPTYYSDEQKIKDLKSYYSNIQDIAIYDYNHIGAEFQTSHSENSITRNWQEREKLFSGIVPIAVL